MKNGCIGHMRRHRATHVLAEFSLLEVKRSGQNLSPYLASAITFTLRTHIGAPAKSLVSFPVSLNNAVTPASPPP